MMSCWLVTVLRRAVVSAPNSEPMLSTEKRSVKVLSPPCRVRCTSSGIVTEKLNAKRPDDRHHHEGHEQLGSLLT